MTLPEEFARANATVNFAGKKDLGKSSNITAFIENYVPVENMIVCRPIFFCRFLIILELFRSF